MTIRCQKALDIDLVSYLGAPDDSCWTGFHGHLLGCADCKAEVEAWRSLRDDLGGEGGNGAQHPAEDDLLAYAEEPHTLGADLIRELEEHVARCLSCRDEVAVIRAIDRAALGSATLGPALARQSVLPTRLAELLPAVTRVAWHPAFAYAIVLLLLIPILRGPAQWGTSTRQLEPVVAADDPRPVKEARKAETAGVTEAARMPSEPVPAESRTRALAPPPLTPPRERQQLSKQPQAKLPTSMSSSVAMDPAATLRRRGLALRSAGLESDERPAVLGRNDPRAALMAAARGEADDAGLTLAFVSGGREVVSLMQLRVKLRVQVPLVLGDGKTLRTEARIVDHARERELRQTFPAAEDTRVVTMFVPSAWLMPGSYLVEIRAVDSPGVGTDLFEFVVRP